MSLSARAAATLADDVEAAAFADLFDAAPAALRSRLGLHIEHVADATLLVAPGLPSSMFNRAIGLGLRQPATMQAVASIIEIYRRNGLKSWWLHWNPWAAPDGFAAHLTGLGFTVPARRSWAKVLRSTASPPERPTDLEIAIARDDQADATTKVIAAVFDMPPFMGEWLSALHGRPRWRLYTVTDADAIVGGGCLFIDAEASWLGMGAIAPSYRRRGAHGALMARRIADSGSAGARYAITETGEPIADEPNPSLANMRRCGFETVASRLNFAGPA